MFEKRYFFQGPSFSVSILQKILGAFGCFREDIYTFLQGHTRNIRMFKSTFNSFPPQVSLQNIPTTNQGKQKKLKPFKKNQLVDKLSSKQQKLFTIYSWSRFGRPDSHSWCESTQKITRWFDSSQTLNHTHIVVPIQISSWTAKKTVGRRENTPSSCWRTLNRKSGTYDATAHQTWFKIFKLPWKQVVVNFHQFYSWNQPQLPKIMAHYVFQVVHIYINFPHVFFRDVTINRKIIV